eukprot:4417078-Heterocapsa_arctica.AAC.2
MVRNIIELVKEHDKHSLIMDSRDFQNKKWQIIEEIRDLDLDKHDSYGFTKGKTFSRVGPGRIARFPNESASAIQP